MACAVKVIAHSVCNGVQLITLQLRYWRGIHAEFMTHRVFSRNAGSSRAKPVKLMLEQVRNDPAGPIHWGKNQPGMQAREEHDAIVKLELGVGTMELTKYEAWNMAALQAAKIAEAMSDAGYHKQVVNRLLEPFQYIEVVVSSTEWENFFLLRDHEDAQPEIRELAVEMKKAIAGSTVNVLSPGEWHLPYVLDQERDMLPAIDLAKISAARCARVSYKTFEGTNPKISEDLKLFEKLAGSTPAHLSPLEHPATPGLTPKEKHGNFTGWRQLRQFYEQGELV